MEKKIALLKEEVTEELTGNILPFWVKMADLEHGGFLGQITGENVPMHKANKGGVLNARILWTFSAAYRHLQNPILLTYATRAKEYLLNYFFDNENGGIYWMLDYLGQPVDTKKQIYALGFALYGLSEYHRATGDQEALDAAIRLYQDIEKHSYDKDKGGYFEAFTADWKELGDVRLSNKDANEKKTMNTHLHILEPYTNLYRIWPDKELKSKLENLINVFLDHILDKETYHLNLFFNEQWESRASIISYGHDIEASWLLHEAALVIGNPQLLSRVEPIILKIAEAAAEGIEPDGSMIYEYKPQEAHRDMERHWWVQAEAVVGYLNAYQLTNNKIHLTKSIDCWTYIKNNLIDKAKGEWYWSISSKGTKNQKQDKAGPWKCPYHNTRMCLEIMERYPNH